LLSRAAQDNLSEPERAHVRREAARHSELLCRGYTNQWGMSMLGLCLRDRPVSSLVSFDSLAAFYRRVGLPHVAGEIEAAEAEGTPLSATMLSDWLARFDVEENGWRGWLTGLLLGYPLWTTVARYHSGGFKQPGQYSGVKP